MPDSKGTCDEDKTTDDKGEHNVNVIVSQFIF